MTNSTISSTTTKQANTKKISRPKQRYNLCEIWWDDPTGLKDGWIKSLQEIKPELVLSVGFLIMDGPAYIIIAQDTDSEGNHNGRTQIPVGNIKKIKILRKKDPEIAKTEV